MNNKILKKNKNSIIWTGNVEITYKMSWEIKSIKFPFFFPKSNFLFSILNVIKLVGFHIKEKIQKRNQKFSFQIKWKMSKHPWSTSCVIQKQANQFKEKYDALPQESKFNLSIDEPQ